MGGTSWDAASYAGYSASRAHVPTAKIYTSRSLHESLDAAKVKCRESCDSVANPNSTPLIVGVDVTGSMGELAGIIVRKGLGTIMENVLKHKPISDPHFLMAAIGDSTCDYAPLQITQFEADSIPLVTQIENIWLEGHGGNNNGESYALLWYFAAYKTKCDAMIKRKRKGYLFTVGDERVLEKISPEEINRVFGDTVQAGIDVKDLLDVVRQNWEVFHIIVDTNACRSQNSPRQWKEILGNHAITIQDPDLLAETIVTTIRIYEGEDRNKVVADWDGNKSLAVKQATSNIGSRADAEEIIKI